MIPGLSRVRVLRSWGGIVDMSMDGSPIIDKTHIEGLFINAGWCYGGFKATPASGWCFAHTIAKNEAHKLNQAFRLDRFRRGYMIDEKGQGQPPTFIDHMIIDCPHCGKRPIEEFTFLGDAEPARPELIEPSTAEQWFDYVYLRNNPRGLFYIMHITPADAELGWWLREIHRPTMYSQLQRRVNLKEQNMELGRDVVSSPKRRSHRPRQFAAIHL